MASFAVQRKELRCFYGFSTILFKVYSLIILKFFANFRLDILIKYIVIKKSFSFLESYFLLHFKGPEDDDFCETLSDKEPYYGFTGTLKCLRDGAGDVALVHTHDVMTNYDVLYKEFDIVCKNTRLSLDWGNVVKSDCHLTEEHPQVCNTLGLLESYNNAGTFSGPSHNVSAMIIRYNFS